MPGKSLSKRSPSIFLIFLAKETVEVIEASDLIMSVEVIKATEVFTDDGIPSEILLSFRTEVVEDKDIIINQIQGSQVKIPHLMNVHILFL